MITFCNCICYFVCTYRDVIGKAIEFSVIFSLFDYKVLTKDLIIK